jgi:hypothetical protein
MIRRKCTVCGERISGGRLLAAPIRMLAALLLAFGCGVPAVRADVELGHEGETGRHRLADMYDSPGAVCDVVLPGRESLGETWLRVNPPVLFARDRTAGLDEQYVGWRATVFARNARSGDWQVVRRSPTTRAIASDDLATYFNGQGWLAGFPLTRASFSVTVEMLWYDPADSRHVEGMALHAVEHYAVFLRHDGETLIGRTAPECRAPG